MNIFVVLTAFVSEYLDSGLGMGYGTALAPVLIMMGYHPLQVVPAILVSQLCTDIAACLLHHHCANVDLRPRSRDFRIACLLGLLGSAGAAVAVFVALRIPPLVLHLYIGLVVLSMGALIVVCRRTSFPFSWTKVAGISTLAAFNKGISGGGYGPLLMGGQILSGVHPKNAVGITAFAEAMTCAAGFLCHLLLGKQIDWNLTFLLTVSATLAVPCAAFSVKHAQGGVLRRYAGILIMLLGALTLLRIRS